MRRFRRSKSDKVSDFSTFPSTSNASSKLSHISVPQKDAIAIQPPKKVIKALYDYQAPTSSEENIYLSFNQGDFLHVVGREDDPDWYEACNPIHGVRGLVPVNYFEIIGKQHQQQQQQQYYPRQQQSEGEFVGKEQAATGHDSGFAEPDQSSFSDSNSNTTTRKSMGRGVGAGSMVYGIVQYDFNAERPDELDARAGEAIIVIAQSNPEWFVAKPITRLGGPGLIPVSFIEIRDMTTGLAVPDTLEAVTRAGVPKVEEWKRMAAEYKNSSIPLGQLSASYGQQGTNASAQQSMLPHARNGSQATDSQQYQSSPPSHIRTSQLLSPIRARVPNFHHHNGDFWFDVDATMEDGKSWHLERNYKDFYGLQLNLIEEFPEAAGKVEGCARTLPYIPGPLPWVTEHLTNERRGKLDQYISALLQMSPNITNSHPVKTFFYPREHDSEKYVAEEERQEAMRLSAGSHTSSQQQYDSSRQSSTANLNAGTRGSSSSSPPPPQQYQQQMLQSQGKPVPQHHRTTSELRAPPPMLRNNSNMTTGSGNSNLGHAAASNVASKIKVWFGDSNCVVVRLPAIFTYAELVSKLKDRYALELGVDKAKAQEADFAIEYKDEPSQGYYKLNGDEELEMARSRNEKLTLKVQAMAQM